MLPRDYDERRKPVYNEYVLSLVNKNELHIRKFLKRLDLRERQGIK